MSLLYRLKRGSIVFKYLILTVVFFGMSYFVLFNLHPELLYPHPEKNHQHIPHESCSSPTNDKRDWDKMGALISTIEITLTIVLFIISIVAASFGVYLKELISNIKTIEKNVEKRHEKIDIKLEEQHKKINSKLNKHHNEIDNKLEDFSTIDAEIQKHFEDYKNNDKRVIFNRKAIEQTLIQCINKSEGDLRKALNIYTRLIEKYDILLPHDYNNETSDPHTKEDMEIAATILYAEKEYVPTFVTNMLLDEKRLPPEIRKIIISG